MFKGKHLISPDDLTTNQFTEIIELARDIIKSPVEFSNSCNGKILGTLFFEPSTRTRLSFEAAMQRLGGSCIGFSESGSSSTSKGESLSDTVQTVCAYTDIIAMRHPKEGSSWLASKRSSVPLINAGDGGHHHPTQTLTDLLTIAENKDRLDHLKIGFCGDLKFGRTVHSLVKTMARYEGNEFVLISPEELQLPDYVKAMLKEKGSTNYREVERLDDVIGELDVLYMTRVQKERFFNEADYVRLKDFYILDMEKMKLAKEDMIVMHPLPRVNEIAIEVDEDPRAKYFEQVKYGMYARMALILKCLGVK